MGSSAIAATSKPCKSIVLTVLGHNGGAITASIVGIANDQSTEGEQETGNFEVANPVPSTSKSSSRSIRLRDYFSRHRHRSSESASDSRTKRPMTVQDVLLEAIPLFQQGLLDASDPSRKPGLAIRRNRWSCLGEVLNVESSAALQWLSSQNKGSSLQAFVNTPQSTDYAATHKPLKHEDVLTADPATIGAAGAIESDVDASSVPDNIKSLLVAHGRKALNIKDKPERQTEGQYFTVGTASSQGQAPASSIIGLEMHKGDSIALTWLSVKPDETDSPGECSVCLWASQ